MFIMVSGKNPRYFNQEETLILLTITTVDGDIYDYPCSANDSVQFSRELWQKVVNGDFGEIAPYTQVEVSAEEKLENLKNQTLLALSKSDITILRCHENDIKVPPEWVQYRKNLRTVLSYTTWNDCYVLPVTPLSYPLGS